MPILVEPRYFVYELVDPRDGSVFYVGKGTGKRPYAHAAEARAHNFKNPAKVKRILEIFDTGQEVEIRYVHVDLYEREAYRLEREQIASHGLKNLTNISRGQSVELEGMIAECEYDLFNMDLLLLNYITGNLKLTEAEFGGVLQTAIELEKALKNPESIDELEIHPDGSIWLSETLPLAFEAMPA